MLKRVITAIYDDGILKPRERLPLPNHTKVRILFDWPTSTGKRTQGLLRVDPRTVRIVVESDEFSVLSA